MLISLLSCCGMQTKIQNFNVIISFINYIFFSFPFISCQQKRPDDIYLYSIHFIIKRKIKFDGDGWIWLSHFNYGQMDRLACLVQAGCPYKPWGLFLKIYLFKIKV